MISPPNGLDADNAPALAYVQAVPNCRLHFVALSGSDSGDKQFVALTVKVKVYLLISMLEIFLMRMEV